MQLTNAMPNTEMPVISGNVTMRCRRCGTEQVMAPEEQAWYYERGFELPKRCAECRKLRRKAKRERMIRKRIKARESKLIASEETNG
jgi:late competence protein required for DNA uptake (superfamily II DNA/RNA helicase)